MGRKKQQAELLCSGTVESVQVSAIDPSPFQVRKQFDKVSLRDMAETVRRNGVLQGVILRPSPKKGRYQLVAGERRWRAAKAAGLKAIPAKVRKLSDAEAIELSCIENLQREDLSPSEEAQAMQNLLNVGFPAEKIAERLGKSESYVHDRLSLLKLPEKVQRMCDEGTITMTHAQVLRDLPSTQDQLEAAQMAEEQHLTAVELKARTQHKLEPVTRPLPKAPARVFGSEDLSRAIVSFQADLQRFDLDENLPAQKRQALSRQITILIKVLQKVQERMVAKPTQEK